MFEYFERAKTGFSPVTGKNLIYGEYLNQFVSYDNLYQLIGADHPLQDDESFSYDSVGNRLTDSSSSYAYNNMNQLIEDTRFIYNYDENGNLIYKEDKGTGETHHYIFNAENTMVGFEKRDAGGELLVKAEYRYDAFGRRIYKAVDENGDGVDDYVRKWVYDNNNMLLVHDGSGNLVAKYTSTDWIDEILSLHDNNGDYFFLRNALNSVQEIFDQNGLIVQKYKYNSFGEITEMLDPAFENSFTYTGREFDKESGLYYYRARYYDAGTGRFISEDPLGFIENSNFYIYVYNMPLQFQDPKGKGIIDCVKCVYKSKAYDDAQKECGKEFEKQCKEGKNKGKSQTEVYIEYMEKNNSQWLSDAETKCIKEKLGVENYIQTLVDCSKCSIVKLPSPKKP